MSWSTIGLMTLESALLALPLVVLSRFVHELVPSPARPSRSCRGSVPWD